MRGSSGQNIEGDPCRDTAVAGETYAGSRSWVGQGLVRGGGKNSSGMRRDKDRMGGRDSRRDRISATTTRGAAYTRKRGEWGE